jgi:hypothetical protein
MDLAKRERAFAAKLGHSERAKRLYPKLKELIDEHQRRIMTAKTPVQAELLELEVVWIEQARELLRILEQEQWRQREGAKLFLCGHIDRSALRNISETWNNDSVKS